MHMAVARMSDTFICFISPLQWMHANLLVLIINAVHTKCVHRHTPIPSWGMCSLASILQHDRLLNEGMCVVAMVHKFCV